MNDPTFDHFCQLVRSRSGLVLTPEKAYLVNSRLAPVARAEGLAGVPALLARLQAGAGEPLVQRCVDAMATHESFFFRDVTPFDQLAQTILPQMVAGRAATQRSLRIWCAACSSGQEPYSVAMVLQEFAGLSGWRLEIVATDMSRPDPAKARSGVYSDFEARRGLSEPRLKALVQAGRPFLAHRPAAAADGVPSGPTTSCTGSPGWDSSTSSCAATC